MPDQTANAEATDPQSDIRARFIAQGENPDVARKALEDATSLSRGLWLSFLTFGTYLVITFAGVTHRDLLLEEPITLPVLNAPLPLVTFFWVAPILFVIFHLYLLLSLKLLADQVHAYLGQMEEAGLDTDAQDKARLQLPNFVIVQVLGGTSAHLGSWAGWLMRVTAWLTLAAGPIILLLFAQLMFLPYHGWWVTMAHRVTVVIDLMLIWYFWRAITRPEGGGFHLRAGMANAAVVVIAFFVLMYPGERFYGPFPKTLFYNTGIDRHFSQSTDFLYNTLSLEGQSFVGQKLFDEIDARNLSNNIPSREGERSIPSVLAHRDIQYANFRNADLRLANFSKSILDGTAFDSALLQGASFEEASLIEASLKQAFGQGSNFAFANMAGASLDSARLQGATLTGAELYGASLSSTMLQGALLGSSDLRGGWFHSTALQAAMLGGADFRAARIKMANLQGATMSGHWTQGSYLSSVNVWRSKVSGDFDLARIVDFDARPLAQDQFHRLVSDAVMGMPKSDIDGFTRSLAILDPSSSFTDDFAKWAKAARYSSRTNFSSEFVASLATTVCDSEVAPFGAQEFVSTRFDEENGDLGEEALPLVEALLAGCPGAVGMDQATIDRLQELKAKFTSSKNVQPLQGNPP